MSQFAILIYEDPTYYAALAPEGWAAVVEAHGAFVQKVGELGGSITGGAALAPLATAKKLVNGTVTDGPFVQSAETLNGYYVVEARDIDHAIEMGRYCPAPSVDGGVEVRPIVDPSSNPF